MVIKTMTTTESPLKGKIDQYNGFIVDPSGLPKDAAEMERLLEASMLFWRTNKMRGLWLNIPKELSHLIPVVTKFGFEFHHCQKEYVMLTQWLAPEENKMPNYSTHYIGVGSVVINDKQEILLVLEKYADNASRWKVPGGLVDAGENLGEAACREVWEETGIKCEFQSILGFRTKNKYLWNQSDIYFVCKLKPLALDIQIDQREIVDCKWTPLEEFYRYELTYNTQKTIARVVMAAVGNGNDVSETIAFSEEEIPAKGSEPFKFFAHAGARSIPLGAPYAN
jgi:8-oxo-dGTP pyrophosphatase MutT (NUDIX family)